MKDFNNIKAIILPINSKGEILIQDRRGHKKPDWGFFGGEVEEGESPLQAVIRETKEELDIDVREDELEYLGENVSIWSNDGKEIKVLKYLHLYKTDQKEFNVLEGKGAHWMTFEEALAKLEKEEGFEEIQEMIRE